LRLSGILSFSDGVAVGELSCTAVEREQTNNSSLHVKYVLSVTTPATQIPKKFPTKGSQKMAPDESPKSVKVSKEDFNVISNRIAVALAKRESLIKSWTASSSRPRPAEKTQAELDAEDAALFRSEPPFLGVGAPIPSHFLVSEAERNNKSLRAKFFPSKTLKATKARDAEEKAASAKRGLKDESSDEEEGRSGLGRAKKRKTKTRAEPADEAGKNGGLGRLDNEGGSEPSRTQATIVNHILKAGKDVVSAEIEEKNLPDLTISSKEHKSEKGDKAAAELVVTTNGDLKTIPAILQGNGVTDPKELKRLKNREKKRKKKQRLRAAGKP
jgi:hypothetical protein